MPADLRVLLGPWGVTAALGPRVGGWGGLTVASLGAGSSRTSALGSQAANWQTQRTINCAALPPASG